MTDSRIESAKKVARQRLPPKDAARNLGVSVPTPYRWVETPWELRRRAEAARLSWLAALVHLRGRAITDSLTDLVDTVHRINAKAKRRVDEALLDDLRRVTGKTNLLFRLADTTLAQPPAQLITVPGGVPSCATRTNRTTDR